MILQELHGKLEERWPGITNNPRFPAYLKQLNAYLAEPGAEGELSLWPCLDSKPPDLFYFYQDLWAAHEVLLTNPSLLVDVGSTVLMVGFLALFMQVVSIDIRPLRARTANLQSLRADIRSLPFPDESLEMLTSMCVIEHVGLGRYGADLDTQGSRRAFREIGRVVKAGGHMIFSLPLGNESSLQFNAHRIFTKTQALNELPGFHLQRERFLFPHPGSEEMMVRLKPTQYCVWCAHMVKD